MKKIFLVSLAICALFIISGCGGTDGPFTISFDLYYYGAPAAPNNITLNSDEQIGNKLPPAPKAPDGLVFLGWFRHTADGNWKKVGANDTFSASTTLYARWNDCWYISFNLNYLFAPPSPEGIVLITGEQIGNKLPADPDERDGFTFLGWFNAQTGGTKVTAADTFNADTTLYAQWQDDRPEITISFNLNYTTTTSPPPSVTIKSGDMITYLNIPTVMRDGLYRFRGWTTAAAGGVNVVRTTTFSSDTVLYARWADLVGFELDVTDYYKGTSAEEFFGGAFGKPATYTVEQDGSLTADFPDPNEFTTNNNVPQGMFINLSTEQIEKILALSSDTKLEVVLDATSVPDTVEFRYFVAANPALGENWQATNATATGTLSAIANQTVSFSNADRAKTTVCFFLQLRGLNLPAPIKVNIKSVLIRWEEE